MGDRNRFDEWARWRVEQRRRQFVQGLEIWSLAFPALAVLTGWWALQGDRLMMRISVFFVVSTLVCWWLLSRYRNGAGPTIDSTVFGAHLRDARSTTFGVCWCIAALGGYCAFSGGFSPAANFYLLTIAAMLLWAAGLLLALRPKVSVLRSSRELFSAFVIGVGSIGVGGVGTVYAVGWGYTLRYGAVSFDERSVLEKRTPIGRYSCRHQVKLSSEPGIVMHCVSAHEWEQLNQGSKVAVELRTSPFGSIATVDESANP